MRIGDLMDETGVSFGTSGARGPVADMTDRLCYAYTLGFVQYLSATERLAPGAAIGIAGDYRSSTPRILTACTRAIADSGHAVRHFGNIPAPALAAYGFAQAMPTLMVTGSHIPDDRNGIKFNLADGEILKDDEAALRDCAVAIPEALFAPSGAFATAPPALPTAEPTAFNAYVRRYLDFFSPDALAGLRIGLYEHSSVARDALAAILAGLGATVTRLGFSARFLPVDTEAIRPEDVVLARQWAATGVFDALVSTDGDGDRPLLGDEQGRWLRGDIAGILCARALGAHAVVTPVSSNTAVESCGWFAEVLRTRIGSPYVIAGMCELVARGHAPVVGYEANGGFLLANPVTRDGRTLPALPTRDAVVVAVAVLAAVKAQRCQLSALGADLPPRVTDSDRIRDFPAERARACLATFDTGDAERDKAALATVFAEACGEVIDIDRTDGLRLRFDTGEILHLRPSGNAPELRVYAEADAAERARALLDIGIDRLRGWL